MKKTQLRESAKAYFRDAASSCLDRKHPDLTSKADGKVSRRKFLKTTMAVAVGITVIPNGIQGMVNAARPPGIPRRKNSGIVGIAMATSRENNRFRVDLISLKNSRVITTFHDFHASHAVVPVEHLNRFFVHGRKIKTGRGVLMGIQVNPMTERWHLIYEQEIDGGMPLHWQPNRDCSLIQYNTIGDGALHVLNTQSLELESYHGGGRHSNMAFYNNANWLVATDNLRGGTTLRVIQRKTGEILSETPAGAWGHGVTVNDATKRAFVWASDGVHCIDLREKNLGQHLGVVKPLQRGQRSWFCWTPQGHRFSHDQTWNPNDVFSPWLTVLDMEKDQLIKVKVDREELGTLAISPDGLLGACGSHSSKNACLFDIPSNRFIGKVKIGRGNNDFFDRDIAFSRDRSIVFFTNPPEKTITAVHTKRLAVVGEIDLPARPQWLKVLTV